MLTERNNQVQETRGLLFRLRGVYFWPFYLPIFLPYQLDIYDKRKYAEEHLAVPKLTHRERAVFAAEFSNFLEQRRQETVL